MFHPASCAAGSILGCIRGYFINPIGADRADINVKNRFRFIASVLGMVASVPLVITGKANRKSHLPFGPLLIAGTIIVVLFGEQLTNWYAGLLMGF